MFCPLCGQSNTDNSPDCISCGRPLPQAAASSGPILGVENVPFTQPPKKGEEFGQPPDRIYAAFWYRFLAFFIDSIVVGTAVYSLILIFMLIGLGLGLSLTELAHMGEDDDLSALAVIGIILVVYVMPFIGSMLYYSLMESSSKQATLGKMAVGIKVTDEYGNRISWRQALGRFFAHIVTHFTLLIGFVICVFTRRQQTLHDLIAGTLVVYKNVTTQDLEKYPGVRADAVQKVTAVGALVMIYFFYIVMIIGIIYFAASDIEPEIDESEHYSSGAGNEILTVELAGYGAVDAVDENACAQGLVV